MALQRPRLRKPHAIAFAVTAALGAVVALGMPDNWSNLESTPSFMAWLIAPAFLAFLGLCLATLTDFVSNEGANPHWLDALWITSVALVTGAYGVIATSAVTWVKRIRGGRP